MEKCLLDIVVGQETVTLSCPPQVHVIPTSKVPASLRTKQNRPFLEQLFKH
jgi:hypothetical protein